jgi:SAM-dependent methyltransferase
MVPDKCWGGESRVRAPREWLVGSKAHAARLALPWRRAPAAKLLQIDAQHIPFRDEFDVIGAFGIIEYVGEDVKVRREMFAARRPGDGIVVALSQHE